MMVNDFVLDDIYETLDEYMESQFKIDGVSSKSTDGIFERVYELSDCLENIVFYISETNIKVEMQYFKWSNDHEPEPGYIIEDTEDITHEFWSHHNEFMNNLETARKEFYGI